MFRDIRKNLTYVAVFFARTKCSMKLSSPAGHNIEFVPLHPPLTKRGSPADQARSRLLQGENCNEMKKKALYSRRRQEEEEGGGGGGEWAIRKRGGEGNKERELEHDEKEGK